jgi:peptidoglycan/LPS O-acetylase OafA/YrhL
MVTQMLPLGPPKLRLSATTGVLGMSRFFCLSGFLISMTLLCRPSLREFLVRRVCRILPLAWLYLLIVLPLIKAPREMYPAFSSSTSISPHGRRRPTLSITGASVWKCNSMRWWPLGSWSVDAIAC